MKGIGAASLREHVIRPALTHMRLWSQAAENLLMGTAAQESAMGFHLKQIRGPALGVFQVEPLTHRDLWRNWLRHRIADEALLLRLVGPHHRSADMYELVVPGAMVTNLLYAAAIARLVYFRRPEPLPEADDLDGLAAYWKAHYNTPQGKGTEAEFVRNYLTFVGEH